MVQGNQNGSNYSFFSYSDIYLHFLELSLLVSYDFCLLLSLHCSCLKYLVLALAESFQLRLLRLGMLHSTLLIVSHSSTRARNVPLVGLFPLQSSPNQLSPASRLLDQVSTWSVIGFIPIHLTFRQMGHIHFVNSKSNKELFLATRHLRTTS